MPRVRVDQILNFNWKFLVPLSLVLVFAVAIVDKLIPEGTGVVARMAIHLALNLLLALGTLQLLRRRGRQMREAMSGGDGPGGRETLHDSGHGPADHGPAAPEPALRDAGDLPLGAREPITVPIH